MSSSENVKAWAIAVSTRNEKFVEFSHPSGIVTLRSGTTAYLPGNPLNFGNPELVVRAIMSQDKAEYSKFFKAAAI
jgi:hypothetical protein